MRSLDCEALGTAAPSKGSFGRQGGVLTPQSEALRTVSPSKESFGRQEAVPAPRQHQGV